MNRLYRKMNQYFTSHKTVGRWLKGLNIISTVPAFVMYPLLVVYLFLKRDSRLKTYLTIPAGTFLLVSLFRGIVNRPRPYEAFGKPSLIKKDKKGHSFPSRHVFSSFLIAVLWLPVASVVGIGLLVISFILALVRVAGGVHYISDVLVGAFAGIISGLASIKIKI